MIPLSIPSLAALLSSVDQEDLASSKATALLTDYLVEGDERPKN
jgi:hypothetical protein